MPSPALFIIGLVIAFIYGTTIGSFLNVCIYRLPAGESLIHPPSHCPKCQTRLKVADLVPLFSYLLLRGRCRYCGTRISPRYFTIELLTGFLFVAVWWSLAARIPEVLPTLNGFVLLVLALVWVSAMLVTFMIDLDTTYVIEPVTWMAMAAGLLFEVALKWGTLEPVGIHVGTRLLPYLPAAVPGMIIGFLVFIGIDLFGALIFRKPSMGVGDAYIGAAIGAMLGPGLALLSFGMAVLLAVVVGVTLLTVQAARAHKTTLDASVELAAPEEASRAYLPLAPFFGGVLALGVLWLVEVGISVVLGTNFGSENSLVALVAPILFGALVIITLILLEPLWPKQTVEVEATANEPEPEEELPAGNYIPFGPFLTACAVLVALLPGPVLTGAQALWNWYLHLYR